MQTKTLSLPCGSLRATSCTGLRSGPVRVDTRRWRCATVQCRWVPTRVPSRATRGGSHRAFGSGYGSVMSHDLLRADGTSVSLSRRLVDPARQQGTGVRELATRLGSSSARLRLIHRVRCTATDQPRDAHYLAKRPNLPNLYNASPWKLSSFCDRLMMPNQQVAPLLAYRK